MTWPALPLPAVHAAPAAPAVPSLQSGEAKKARKLAELRAELAGRGRSWEEVEEILGMPALDSITW